MGIDHGGFYIAVAEQFLNRADVGSLFQYVRGKRMAEGVAGRRFLIPAYCIINARNSGRDFLWNKGFFIKEPASWRELHARGQKLLRLGTVVAEVPERLGISEERWREIVGSCSQRAVSMKVEEHL